MGGSYLSKIALKVQLTYGLQLTIKQSGQIAESGSQTILANDCQIWQYLP